MGLAEARKRRKIGHDPNNTNWTTNTSTYGHKILSSQGWAPGSTLGAENASHSSHFTAASTSHIRVLLKDDNLGLGARHGGRQEDNFGLGQLQSIYGRLNGKSETQLKKEEDVRHDLGTQRYMQQKYGDMPFVRGGYLVGDRIEDRYMPLETDPNVIKTEVIVKDEPKIKLEEGAEDMVKTEPVDADVKIEIKEEEPEDKPLISDAEAERLKKERKRAKRRKEEVNAPPNEDPGTEPWSEQPIQYKNKPDKATRRLEKQARRANREARRLAKAQARASRPDDAAATSSEATGLSTPAEPAFTPVESVPVVTPFNNRNAVRQRFIKQKRMASMDPQALREILMQKA